MSVLQAAPWKLYGVPLSQPFRSVAWALLQNHIRFDVQLVVPGIDNKIGSRSEAYRALSRMRGTKIPLLEDTRTGFTIAESPAILSYLCDYYGWNDSLYAPPGTPKRATIDSYMHWHHTGTRKFAALVFPYFRPDAGAMTAQDAEKGRQKVAQTLQTLEEGWFAPLSDSDDNSNSSKDDDYFLAGGTNATIADLLAYEEIVQLPMLGLVREDTFQADYPKIHAWTRRMAQLPYHEEIHVAMAIMGDVTDHATNEVPVMERLRVANKAALKALTDAQSTFGEAPNSKL